MKPEDIEFPVEVEVKHKGRVYDINFSRRTWCKWCCDSRQIKGMVRSKIVPKRLKGFKFNKDIEPWNYRTSFEFCPVCGKSNLSYSSKVIDPVRKAWINLINKIK